MKHTKTLVISAALLALGACNKESKQTSAEPDPAPKVTSGEGDKPAATTGLAAAAGTYKLDPVHSFVAFKIGHMNVSETLGLFNKVSGDLVLGKTGAESSVNIKVDAGSVFTANKKRDDHLKSPDFLNVAQFPEITFKSTAIESLGDDRYKVTGDLTLHGVTKAVTAEFVHVGSGKNMMDPKVFLTGFTGELAIKRTDFGMTNMVGPAGDEVELTIAVEAIRQ